MKKFKKTIVAALTAATAISAVPMINSSAAQAANDEPKMYLDFTIESDGDIRADVVIENMPDISSGAFHIVLDEGLRFTKDSDGYDIDVLDTLKRAHTDCEIITDNLAVFTFAHSYNKDCNGHIVSFYVERTELNNPFNSTGKIEFQSTPNASDSLLSLKGEFIYDPSKGLGSVNTPEMLESNEYLVGDVCEDGRINSVDASRVLRQVEFYGAIRISDFNGNYNDAIEDLRSAYAADVNKDGFITKADADAILRYYTLMMAEKPYDGNIGKVDIYEIYND